jgi:hypothetical protein
MLLFLTSLTSRVRKVFFDVSFLGNEFPCATVKLCQLSFTMTHLFVLVHGIELLPYAGPNCLRYLSMRMRETHQDNAVVHVVECNKHSLWHRRTHDGIDVGGRRVADEIRQVIEAHGSKLQHISFIGFSLGGLYCRYAAAVLYDKETKLIGGLLPVHFITLATPHLGVRNSFPVERGFQLATGVIFGRTGRQLFMQDDACLLHEMTQDGALPFIAALEAFPVRTLYANTCSDFQASPLPPPPHASVSAAAISDAAPPPPLPLPAHPRRPP